MKKKILIIFGFFFLSFGSASAHEKIIPMAPNLVETVYALGMGNKVAAVPMFTVFPKAAADKPKAGNYLNPSYEAILNISPDLIIVQGKFHKLKKFTDMYDIPVLRVNMDSIDSIYSGIKEIGTKLECENKAYELINKIKSNLLTKKHKFKKKPDVFICLGRIPGSLRQISTAGSKSFISELINISGGINIFSDIDNNYVTVSKEEIKKRDPDIIIDVMPEVELNFEKKEKVKKIWQRLMPENQNIFILNQNYILIPGPRITKTSDLFKEVLRKAEIE
jgi:iron complex transport system substrate-binding protein